MRDRARFMTDSKFDDFLFQTREQFNSRSVRFRDSIRLLRSTVTALYICFQPLWGHNVSREKLCTLIPSLFAIFFFSQILVTCIRCLEWK